MDRKIKSVCIACMLSLFFLSLWTDPAKAYDVYEQQPSTNITSVFRDIVSKINLTDDYVYFRGGQYEYYLVAGDLTYENDNFTLSESGQIYSILLTNSYNSDYSYIVSSISDFSLSVSDQLIYSNLGGYPDLIGYDVKYEIYQTIIFVVALLCCLIFRIFPRSKCTRY